MNTKNIAVGYHPTTVIFIDDNRKYLDGLKGNLKTDFFIPRLCDSARRVASFLEQKPEDSFVNRCTTSLEEAVGESSGLHINISKMHLELYRLERYQETVIVVVDYAMPEMNGDIFCEAIQSLGLKVILLTGEADEKKAIDLFNKGLIARYIRKSAAQFNSLLHNSILEMQLQHFQEVSNVVVESLLKEMGPENVCLADPVFIDFFQKLIREEKICEYYLLDQSGSFVLMNVAGGLSWLLVKTEADMNAADFEMHLERENIPTEILKGIHEKKLLRHFFNNTPIPLRPEDWKRVAFKATCLPTKKPSYYALVQHVVPEARLDTKGIVPLRAYLEKYAKEMSAYIAQSEESR